MFSVFKTKKSNSKSLTENIPIAGPSRIQSQEPPTSSRNHAPQNDDNHQYYISGVPFKLSPKILTLNSNEVKQTQTEVDNLLLIVTEKELELRDINYDFKLERSILQNEKGRQMIEKEASTSYKKWNDKR